MDPTGEKALSQSGATEFIQRQEAENPRDGSGLESVTPLRPEQPLNPPPPPAPTLGVESSEAASVLRDTVAPDPAPLKKSPQALMEELQAKQRELEEALKEAAARGGSTSGTGGSGPTSPTSEPPPLPSGGEGRPLEKSAAGASAGAPVTAFQEPTLKEELWWTPNVRRKLGEEAFVGRVTKLILRAVGLSFVDMPPQMQASLLSAAGRNLQRNLEDGLLENMARNVMVATRNCCSDNKLASILVAIYCMQAMGEVFADQLVGAE